MEGTHFMYHVLEFKNNNKKIVWFYKGRTCKRRWKPGKNKSTSAFLFILKHQSRVFIGFEELLSQKVLS